MSAIVRIHYYSYKKKFGGLGTIVAGVCEFVSGLTQLTVGNILSWIQLGLDVIAALIDGPGGQTIEGAWQNHLSRIEKNNTDGMQKITLTTTRRNVANAQCIRKVA